VPETQIRVSKEPPEEEMHRIDVEEEEDKPLKLKVKSVARLTFSQIVQLYSKYLEYRKGLEEYGSQHSQRLTLNDIAEDTQLKKSTIHHYFSKVFPGKSTYINNLFFIYKKRLLRAFRVRKPPLLLLHQEKTVVDWILRARQAGLPVSYSDVREKSREIITSLPGLKFSING